MRTRQHPCLYFHLGRCSAPCCERISEQVYREIIWEIRKILKGHYKELKKNLQEEMDSYSKVLEFEKAAKIRDKLIAIEYLDNKQKIINNNNASEDYIAFDNFKSSYSFSIIKIREGKLIDKENYFIKSIENNQNTLMNFIKTYYTEKSAPPAILYISNRSSECDLIANALSNREKRRIRIILPQKGEKKKLIELTRQNAQFYLERKNAQFAAHSQLISLQKSLELKILPKRIEGFDIATIEGKYSYGSMVSFYNARADKVNYRIFKPAESGSVNDYAMMEEVIARRYSKLKNENREMPDLILVDGGAGQVSTAYSVLEALNLESIPLIGLAKKEELIYIPLKKEPLRLEQSDPGLKLLQLIRDEAHRFANFHHRKTRGKKAVKTELLNISGIGEKTAQLLLEKFKTVAAIKKLDLSELKNTKGITQKMAESVFAYFRKK